MNPSELRPLSSDAPWNEVALAFAHSPALPFRQAWLEKAEPQFQSGEARVLFTPDHLAVWVVLKDTHAANPSRGRNGLHFLRGDVAELFVKPPGGEAYYEFHATPEGETYQILIPSAAGFAMRRAKQMPLEELVQPYLLDPPAAVVRTRLNPSLPGWEALFLFPLPRNTSGPWRFSVCRYDLDEKGFPCLSSASPLTRLDFHYQADWLTVQGPGAP